MWIVLAGVAVIAVAVIVVVAFGRPTGDDLSSVRSYHSALGTMEHLSGRDGLPADTLGRTVGSRPTSDAPRSSREPGATSAPASRGDVRGHPAPGGRVVPPVPVRGNDGFPDPEKPLVFDDSRPLDRIRSHVSAEELSGIRADRAQRQALDSMNHRPKKATSVLIVAAVVVLFGVLAYAGSKRSSSNHPHAASDTASTVSGASHLSSSTSDPSSGSGGHPPGTRSGTKPKAKSKSKDKTTPTTQPSQIVALTSTSSAATYPVATTSYRVTVAATGTCWVAATSVTSGTTLWAGVLQTGAVQVIRASGTITVQLGTPSAYLAVDKVPVIFPRTVRSPFVATFQPTAAATAAASTPAAGSRTTTPTEGTAPTTGSTAPS
jgi:hypothetical protein